jgi:SprT protein
MLRWFRQLELDFGGAKREPRELATNGLEPDPDLSDWCVSQARTFGLDKLAGKVAVTWNRRLRTTAGRAWWPDRYIELNTRLRELPEDETWRTLKHELAHLFAYERAGRRRVQAHGPEWRVACAELGIAGESPCHELPFQSSRQRRKFAYTCPSCDETIERVRRMRGPVACYPCCVRHSGGQFDGRFRLVERAMK